MKRIKEFVLIFVIIMSLCVPGNVFAQSLTDESAPDYAVLGGLINFGDINTDFEISVPGVNFNMPSLQNMYEPIASDWALEEINLAYKNNLVPAVLNGKDLTQKVNRGEFAAIAVQLYEVLANTSVTASASCNFDDIAGNENENSIKKAYKIEVTQGTSATKYEPLSHITREQLATMLCRVIKKYSYPGWSMATDNEYYMQLEGIKKFADDAEISDWAKPSVYFMAKYGIIKGINDTHFAPKNSNSQQEALGYATATREQAIILSQRIFTQADLFA